MNYITKGNTIIFDSLFNEELDHELLTNYNQIIFSNYDLNDVDVNGDGDLFYAYENNDFNNKWWPIESKFNRTVDNLGCY